MKWANECGMFREQVNTMAAWFEQWNECEQTVALYSLLKRLSPTKARFLALALDQSLSECGELQQHEIQANNPGYVGSLLSGCEGPAVRQLLLHLPLLRPGNCEAKARYLAAIHAALGHAVETGAHIEEARQLLSYSLIHPAISNEDRRPLTQWLRHLEERIANSSQVLPLSATESASQQICWGSQPQAGCNGNFSTVPGHQVYGSSSQHGRVRRSNSLTPPVSLNHASELWSSQDDLSGRQKPRSFSLSSDHAPPLSPQSSLASSGSGSETQLEEPRLALGPDPTGMRDVPAWLKSLRLHKYVQLFSQLTYEEMLALSEEWLASQGVTKGARHKIILSVKKLRERYHTLCQLEKEVAEGGNISSALEELKVVLVSPIKPADNINLQDDDLDDSRPPEEGDIPAQFTKVMGKVCTQLLVGGRVQEGDPALPQFVWLLDRALSHDAFSAKMKRRLNSWRIQVQSVWCSIPQPTHTGNLPSSNAATAMQQRHARNRWQHHSQFFSTPPGHHNGFSSPRPQQQRFLPPPASTQSQTARSKMFTPATRSVPTNVAKRPSLQDPLPQPVDTVHLTVKRTHSAPPTKPGSFMSGAVLGFSSSLQGSDGGVDPEINSRLESLCLSMTEHALGGCSES